MKTLELDKASKSLASYATGLGMESIVVTRNRKPVAALVSLRGVDRECSSLSLDPAFMKIIRRARAEVKRGEVFSLEQVKRELLGEGGNGGNSTTRRSRRKKGDLP
jgi:antitoxin (DNA-binding transcriptional repressor) of toxin-antitoxin stability system